MKKRQKKRMAAQRMVQALTALAHNVTIWSRAWLAELSTTAAKKVARLGVMRLIRDVFRVSGRICLDYTGRVEKIVLNRADPMGRAVAEALASLLDCEHVSVRLGEL
jgi:hypothetical protein